MTDWTVSADFRAKLKNLLSRAPRVALLAVGSELRGDDAAGLLVGQLLGGGRRAGSGAGKGARAGRSAHPSLTVFNGGSAPENLTGALRRLRPTHLIVVDAADMGRRPGSVALLSRESLRGTTPSTHRPSLELLLGYLSSDLGCEVVVIGIQPKSTDLGSAPCREVRAAARGVAKAISETLG